MSSSLYSSVVRRVLPNGLTLLARHSPDLPLTAVTLLVRSGSLYESSEEAGLANLTAEVMLQGTRRYSAHQIADHMESMGAFLGAQSSEDYTELGFVAPTLHLDKALELLAETLIRPIFPESELEKERAGALASLHSRADTIFNCAYDCFSAHLYGTHPYGRPVEGTSDRLKRFPRKDLVCWHERFFRPDRAILSVVSSLPTVHLQNLIQTRLSGWRRAQAALHPLSLPRVPTHRKIQRVQLKRSFEQAYLMTGVQAPNASDPAHLHLKVLNTILGGGMSSRLFVHLREKSGLAYEVSSFYPTHLFPSEWVAYIGLPVEKLSQARKQLEDLIHGFRTNGPTAAEVRQAIQMIKGSFLMEHQTRRRQAWYAAWWEFLGRGYEYGNHFVEEVESITLDHLRETARRLWSQPRVTVEVVP